jgi:multiple sugar transport system substrate-binding protein
MFLAIVSLMLVASRCQYLSEPYFEELGARISADEVPDVGYVDAFRVVDLVASGALSPVDEVVNVADFEPSLLDVYTVDGVVYGLPRDFQTISLFVNTGRFEEVGAELPTTWDELFAVSEILAESGRPGLGLVAAAWNLLPFVYQGGGEVFSPDGTFVLAEAPVEGVEFFLELAQAEHTVVFRASDDGGPFYGSTEALIRAFGNGEIAMMYGPNNVYEILRQEGVQFSVETLPAGPIGPTTIAYVAGLGVFEESSEAFELLTFAAGPTGQEVWSESPIYMPPATSLWDAWAERHPDSVAFIAGATDMTTNYVSPSWSFEEIATYDLESREPIELAMAGDLDLDGLLIALTALADVRG